LPFGNDQYLIAGQFSVYDGTPMNCIALINNDGSLDLSFASPTGITGGGIYAMQYAFDQNGIIIGGDFTGPYAGIAKYDLSGTIDGSFNPGSGVFDALGATVNDIVVRASSIVIVGFFTEFDGNLVGRVAQLLSDGSFDGLSNNSGTGADAVIFDIEEMPGGKLLLSGAMSSYDGNPSKGAVMVDSDLSFTVPSLVGAGFNGYSEIVYKTHRMADGRIVAVGAFTAYGATSATCITRLNSDLTVDPTFDSGTGASAIYTHAPSWDGRDLIAGSFLTYDGNTAIRMARIFGDSCFSRLRGTVTLDGQPVTAGKVYI
jgi:hypothetical protein